MRLALVPNLKILFQRKYLIGFYKWVSIKKTTFFAICFYCNELDKWIFRRTMGPSTSISGINFKWIFPTVPEKQGLDGQQNGLRKVPFFHILTRNPKKTNDPDENKIKCGSRTYNYLWISGQCTCSTYSTHKFLFKILYFQ